MIHFSFTKDKKMIRVNLLYKFDSNIFQKYKEICDGQNARYDSHEETQTTTLDNLPDLMEQLVVAEFKCSIEEDVFESLKELASRIFRDTRDNRKRLRVFEKKLSKKGMALFPFQRTGVEWLAPRRRALLADEMGLGKTIQILMSLRENIPVVVICPNIAKYVWRDMAKVWRKDYRTFIFVGRGNFHWPKPGQIFIFNYDILPGNAPDGIHKNTHVVCDEIHMLKNPSAKRTVFSKELIECALEHKGTVVGASGTPLLNRAEELWVILQALGGLGNDAFGNWRNFVRVFNGSGGGKGMSWGTPSPEAPLMLRKVCLMRKRADVLKDLPAKMYSDVLIDLTDPDVQEQLDEIVSALNDAGVDLKTVTLEELMAQQVVFQKLAKIRADLARVKIPQMIEFIDEFEENDTPLVVFSAHRAPIDILEHREGWVTITGDTSINRRQEIIDEFQKGKYKGIGLTIASGGVGITLTHANHALFVDSMWTPAMNEQAEDRLARIGQKKGVQIYNMVANHPVEMRVHEILAKKEHIITHGVDPAKVDENTTATEYNLRLDVLDKVQVGSVDKIKESAITRMSDVFKKNNDIESKESVKPRQPKNPIEVWAKNALMILSGRNKGGAVESSGIGFNKFDSLLGHDLATRINNGKGLTDNQWRTSINMAKKYQKQVGVPPSL